MHWNELVFYVKYLWNVFIYILNVWWLKEKAATLQVLSSTVQELANQISPAESVQQFVRHLSRSLIGCDRPAAPTGTALSMKRNSDPTLLSPNHSRTLKRSSSVGAVGGDHMIYNLLLKTSDNQSW